MQSTITITINHDDELTPKDVEHELDGLAELVRTVCDRVRLDGTVVIAISEPKVSPQRRRQLLARAEEMAAHIKARP